jgi:Restriction endonuclease BglII
VIIGRDGSAIHKKSSGDPPSALAPNFAAIYAPISIWSYKMLNARLPQFILDHYECYEWKHASAILTQDFPSEWADLVDVLSAFRLRKSWISKGGGNKSQLSTFIDGYLLQRGWVEKQFQTAIEVDGARLDSPTHKIDCFKNGVALEIEWNNKDPFYDRDLNNFRLLFDLRAVSVGIVITRADELQDIFNDLGRGSSYGNSTTHMSKLLPRIQGGGGAGCPLLVFGITKALFVEDDE